MSDTTVDAGHDPKALIARRVAHEIEPGMLVNLGIGLPSLVATYLPKDAGVFFSPRTASSGSAPVRPRAWRSRT